MTDTPRTDEIDWLAIDDAYSEALEERCTCSDWRDDISCRHCSLWGKARSLMRQRIAELETLLREVLRQGCEYHTKKYALLQMDHALIQEIADAIGVAREEEK